MTQKKRHLCSLHAFLATPMWGPQPEDIELVGSTKDCEHCQENAAMVPILMKKFSLK